MASKGAGGCVFKETPVQELRTRTCVDVCCILAKDYWSKLLRNRQNVDIQMLLNCIVTSWHLWQLPSVYRGLNLLPAFPSMFGKERSSVCPAGDVPPNRNRSHSWRVVLFFLFHFGFPQMSFSNSARAQALGRICLFPALVFLPLFCTSLCVGLSRPKAQTWALPRFVKG